MISACVLTFSGAILVVKREKRSIVFEIFGKGCYNFCLSQWESPKNRLVMLFKACSPLHNNFHIVPKYDQKVPIFFRAVAHLVVLGVRGVCGGEAFIV